MAALLSPLQLQAGAALLQDQGIITNSELKDKLDTYNANPLIAPIRDSISTAVGILSNATIGSLQTFASNTCPALADNIPAAFITPFPPTSQIVNTKFAIAPSPTTNPGLTGMVDIVAESYVGNGDVSKFAQIFSAVNGYVVTTNVFINSAVNAQDYLADTFTNMDNLISGDLTQVNLDTQNFGQDLYKLGQAIDLASLDTFGSPLGLLRQISKVSGITTPVVVALLEAGVNENIVLSISDPDLVITDNVQKLIYSAMTTIIGDDLAQILQLLKVTTSGITSLADLLNPVKLFPNSYSTLTAPVCNGCCGNDAQTVVDIGTVIFQTRTPPGGVAVYPLSDSSWGSFMNNNAVWEFSGSVFESRKQSGVTAQTWPYAWSEFMNTNAVWESDIFAPQFIRNYSVTFPSSGLYTFVSQCDNTATVTLNGDQILSVSGFTGAPQITEIYVNAGTYQLGINAVNAGPRSGGNPGGFALNIATASAPLSFTRTYTIDVPATGTYMLTAQTSDTADFSIDSVPVFAIVETRNPKTTTLVLTQGSHTLEISATSSGSPSGVALTITNMFSTGSSAQCGLRGIYMPIPGYSLDVAVPKLTEIEYNYRKLFGRESDPQGYQYWQSTNLTGISLTNAMIASADPIDRTYYQTRRRLGTFPIFQPKVVGATPTGAVTGVVNSQLENNIPENTIGMTYNRLKRIIPEDQALADRALAVSLQQIINISKITLDQLAAAYLNIEANNNLPYINSQRKPVSQDSIDYFLNGLATGSGDNGTILITDVIGTAIGTVSSSQMSNVNTAIDNLTSNGSLGTLTTIYEIILDIINGVYGDPTSGPITGLPSPYDAGEPYADADTVISTVMIPAAQSEITTIMSNNLIDVATLNTAFIDIGTHMSKEANYLKLATLNISELSADSQTSTQTLIFALPSYGSDISEGGTAEYLEAVADITIPAGQAIVACLREGRNKTELNSNGIRTASNISSEPVIPPPQADLIPSQYSQTEAQQRIIT